ncbi:UNVERIFIED_CONTAM: streptothricin acetyltransferase [Brevibacillus sp. OAP136]
MNISIKELEPDYLQEWFHTEGSFVVTSKLVLSVNGRQISYTVQEVPAYQKCYTDEQVDYSSYINNPDQIIYVAFCGDQAVGHILVKRNWNRYACVEEIKVDQTARRTGVGRMLMDRAKKWAHEGGMPGIMLETQNNNVAACRFYERCGFVLGGFDFQVYQGIDSQTDEIALYWYWRGA